MKKKLLITLVALLALAFAVSLVSAATPAVQAPHPYGQQFTLTDQQREELTPLFNQMTEIKKQILQKFVADGVMTQADADQRTAWMQEHMNDRLENGMIGRPGMGNGSGMMGHGRGPGYRGQPQAPINQ